MGRKDKKPEWLNKHLDYKSMREMGHLLRNLYLHTVCEEAHCPNMGECFRRQTATFMILGEICTRNCRFCAIPRGQTSVPDPEEPEHLAVAAEKLGLEHVVITSVTRDDLPDGGAEQFAACVRAVRKRLPSVSVEVLIPDFKGDLNALQTVVNANPEIINHNVETVPSLYHEVRPMANYQRSLNVIKNVKELNPAIFTKSGFMLGLGEEEPQVKEMINDLKAVGCNMLTIGQYLPPSKKHALLKEYIHPDRFNALKAYCDEMGFVYTASGPYVRSSYMASDIFKQIKKTENEIS